MKPTARLRSFLAALGCATLAIQSASADTLYWSGNGSTLGGAGTWDTTNARWAATFAGPFSSIWDNADLDTAVFAGTGGAVTVGTGGITVGGLEFRTNTYSIAAGANGLTFGAANNTIAANGANTAIAASITGTVGGGGNVILRTLNGPSANTITFSGISAGGWTGSTTINQGMTLATTSASGSINQVLNSTSGITLNGGTIQFTRSVTDQLNAISDSAAIGVFGGGTFSVTSSNGSATAIENIGSVTVNSGMMNFVQTANNQNSVVLAGLSRGSSTTSAVSFSSYAVNPFTVTGATATAANEIIGAWAYTGGTGNAAQLTDYAIYNGSSQVVGRNIAASAQSTWSTTHAATSNYTLNMTNVIAPENGRLTASRNINTLRNLTNTAVPNAVDATGDFITMTGNNLQNGDVVVSRNTTGGQMTPGRTYYVIDKDVNGAGTFRVSTTPGGSALDLTTTAVGFVGAGLNLNGQTLGTFGILNGSSDPMAIGGGSGSSITLPTAVSGNLHVTNGNASIWIDAPITNNGAGVLTLVKNGTSGNGSGNVTLAGTNTYTGGTVINSGALNFFTAGSWVSNQNLTFGGTGAVTASVGALTGGILNVSQGANATMTGTSTLTFTSTTGAGTIIYGGGGTGAGILNLGDASAFTGNLISSVATGSNPYPTIRFSSIADTAGSYIGWGGGQGDSGQRATIALTGDAGGVTLNNRQVAILSRNAGNNGLKSSILQNNNTNAANTFVINTDLLNYQDRSGAHFVLEGSNTGNNTFAGNIGDSTVGAFALNLSKGGTGKWILSGTNTFTGRLTISDGTLSVGTLNEVGVAGPLGMNSVIQLGGSERAVNATGLYLTGNTSGTLEYTGGAVTSSRSFVIGETLATATGGGTIANNGTGGITFSAATFNNTIAGVLANGTPSPLTATRTLTLGGTNTGNNEIQGVIQNNAVAGLVAVTKTGTNTWVLSGDNTYDGATNVSEGTLLINGNSSTALGAVSVANTATLGGTGTIGGSVTVANGGTLSPGASIESLASGALTMASGSNFAYEIANNSSTGADLLAVNGTISLTGVNLNFDLATLAALGVNTWNVGDKLTLISYTGTGITSGFVGYTDDTNYNFGGNVWTFNYNDTVAGGNYGADAIAGGQTNFVTLTAFTVIPEPSAALLGGLGVLLLLRRRR